MIGGERLAKGKLVAIGGNEDRKNELKVLGKLVDLCGGRPPVVEVIPVASSEPVELAKDYLQAFRNLNVKDVRVLDARTRAEAEDPKLVERVQEADILFFTGGDQLRITSVLGGSPLLQAILGRYEDGAIIAGTSAGAAAMPATMIFHGGATDGALAKGNVQMTPGLGLITRAIVDTHFVDRGRFSRLIESVAANPGHIGLGLSEDTGVIIHDGERIEVIGSGLVVIVDGHNVGHTNISDVRMGQPVAVENVTVHTLTEGYCYDLTRLRYVPPGERDGKPAPDASSRATS